MKSAAHIVREEMDDSLHPGGVASSLQNASVTRIDSFKVAQKDLGEVGLMGREKLKLLTELFYSICFINVARSIMHAACMSTSVYSIRAENPMICLLLEFVQSCNLINKTVQ